MNDDRDRRPGRDGAPSRPPSPSGLRRIPLPPLPHFRRGGPGDVDAAATPAAAPDPAPPAAVAAQGGAAGAVRTGASGATVMNDLVDEIERQIDRDLGRRAPAAVSPPAYRLTVPCAFDLET